VKVSDDELPLFGWVSGWDRASLHLLDRLGRFRPYDADLAFGETAQREFIPFVGELLCCPVRIRQRRGKLLNRLLLNFYEKLVSDWVSTRPLKILYDCSQFCSLFRLTFLGNSLQFLSGFGLRCRESSLRFVDALLRCHAFNFAVNPSIPDCCPLRKCAGEELAPGHGFRRDHGDAPHRTVPSTFGQAVHLRTL
jgi:hypothetical protein